MNATSPYHRIPVADWPQVTKTVVANHPLMTHEIVDVVLDCWRSIFESKIGRHGFQIGKQIFPKPQIMGFLLHELIPLELQARHPAEWRGDTVAGDKDLVYIPDPGFSIELKTSSHSSRVFGNRSYAQPGSRGKKGKSGYYLAVNFTKFQGGVLPAISRIRFGWLDNADWLGQAAATGQQARLLPDAEKYKLLRLYPP